MPVYSSDTPIKDVLGDTFVKEIASSIAPVKRRGRPPGSKNKPKAPPSREEAVEAFVPSSPENKAPVTMDTPAAVGAPSAPPRERLQDNGYQEQWEDLRRAIDLICILRAPPGSRELPNYDPLLGPYRWQFYMRRVTLTPKYLSFIGNYFWALYGERFKRNNFQVAGVEAGAVPIILAIIIIGKSLGFNVNGFTIRKERKKYGLCNLIEGHVIPNLPVVIVDDLTSPDHATMWHAINSIRDIAVPFYGSVFAVVFKGRKEMKRPIPTSRGPLTIENIYTVENFNLEQTPPVSTRVPSQQR